MPAPREHSPTGVALIICNARDTTILSANDAARLLPGVARAMHSGTAFVDMLPRETAKLVHNFLEDKSSTGGNTVLASPLEGNAGQSLLLRLELQLAGADTAPVLVVAAEETGETTRCNYEELVHEAQSVILRISPEGTVRFINDYGVRFFGFEPEEIVGRSIYDTIVPPQYKTGQPLQEVFRSLSRSEDSFLEHQNENVRSNGEVVWMAWSNKPVFDETGGFVECISVGVDITQIKQMQDRLRFQAERDVLTGLYNRSHMLDLINEVMSASESCQSFALVFIDMDRFKFINDSMGHDFGDEVLREIGRRLTAFCSGQDSVGRFGSDEFILLLRNTASSGEASRHMQNLLRELSRPYASESGEFHLTPSLGMVICPPVSGTAQQLLQWANMATRRAKELGGHRLRVFSKSMLEQTQRRLRLENGLVSGLGRDEFRLVFQPIYALSSTHPPELVGAEALLRWNHPEMGPVSPGEFIPLAEQTGRMGEIFQWVLQHACETFTGFNARYASARTLTISINVSGNQLNLPGLASRVRNTLHASGLEDGQLHLEVTETAIMADPDTARHTLAGLQEMGIGISVDDFGTGYSSMNYLRLLPLDTLKIDLSFVQRMHDSEDDTMIIKTIINLAHSLGLTVVAEGVEMEEHLRILTLLGCDKAQGYHLSRPLELQDFETLLAGQ